MGVLYLGSQPVANCVVNSIRNKDITIEPSTTGKIIPIPSSFSGYGTITLNPVTSAVDSNIKAENIKQGVTILGVTGSAQIPSLQNRTIHITNTSTEVTPETGYNGLSQVNVVVDTTITTLNPSTSSQTVSVPQGYLGFSQVILNPLVLEDKSISSNGTYTYGQGYMGLGTITVEVPSPTLGTKTINSNGTYTASSMSLDGFSSVIADVASAYTNGINRTVVNDVYQYPTENFTFTLPATVTDLGDYALCEQFPTCTTLISADLSNLTTVSGNQALSGTFRGCTNLASVDLSNLTTISGSNALNGISYGCMALTTIDLSSLVVVDGNSAMGGAFQYCTNLTSVDLSSLTTISSAYGLRDSFYGCTSLTTIDLSSLTTINGNSGLTSAFFGCTNLTSVDLSSLTTVTGNTVLTTAFSQSKLTSVNFSNLITLDGNNVMQQTFSSCPNLTALYFPKLKDLGTTYTNHFNGLLNGCSKYVTLHFRYNMQNKISTLTGYSTTAPFGASSGTVLFDLSRAELAFNVTSESGVSIYIDGEAQQV